MNTTTSSITTIIVSANRQPARARPRLQRTPTRSAPLTAPAGAQTDDTPALIEPQAPSTTNQLPALLIVIGLHVLLGYALLSGLAKKVVDVVRAPIEARLIEPERPKPPPPPEQRPKPVVKAVAAPPPFVPPPEVRVETPPPTNTIVAVTPEPPPAAVPFTPTAPPAPVAAVAEAVPMSVACPTMVAPVMPLRAERDGIGGLVRARATIREGRVIDVQILSSTPRGLFDSAVRTAMSQYRCQTTGAAEIVAIQTFKFVAP